VIYSALTTSPCSLFRSLLDACTHACFDNFRPGSRQISTLSGAYRAFSLAPLVSSPSFLILLVSKPHQYSISASERLYISTLIFLWHFLSEMGVLYHSLVARFRDCSIYKFLTAGSSIALYLSDIGLSCAGLALPAGRDPIRSIPRSAAGVRLAKQKHRRHSFVAPLARFLDPRGADRTGAAAVAVLRPLNVVIENYEEAGEARRGSNHPSIRTPGFPQMQFVPDLYSSVMTLWKFPPSNSSVCQSACRFEAVATPIISPARGYVKTLLAGLSSCAAPTIPRPRAGRLHPRMASGQATIHLVLWPKGCMPSRSASTKFRLFTMPDPTRCARGFTLPPYLNPQSRLRFRRPASSQICARACHPILCVRASWLFPSLATLNIRLRTACLFQNARWLTEIHFAR